MMVGVQGWLDRWDFFFHSRKISFASRRAGLSSSKDSFVEVLNLFKAAPINSKTSSLCFWIYNRTKHYDEYLGCY